MPTEIMGAIFYTIDETANELGITGQTVRNHIAKGKLKAVRVGKKVMINKDDILKLLGLDPEA